MTPVFISGFGQFHSDRAGVNPRPYVTLDWQQFGDVLSTPPSVAKEAAQWAIFSELSTRVAAEQRAKGRFHALWCDIDDALGRPIAETAQLACDAVGGAQLVCYTSRSATEENQKARIVIPLAGLLCGDDFELMQKVLNDRLETAGLIPDRATERANQVMYLPNRGAFYDQVQLKGARLDACAVFAADLDAERQRLQAEELRQQEAREQSRLNAINRIASGCTSPVEAFKDAYDLELMLATFGYRKRGTRYLSPLSTSGVAGVTIKDGTNWVSSHGSDVSAGIGKVSGSQCSGDVFDLFVYFEHGGDFNAAIKDAGAMFTTAEGVSITRANQRAYAQAQEAAVAPVDVSDLAWADNPRPANEDEPDDHQDAPQLHIGVDVNNPPGTTGRICDFIKATAHRRMDSLYPFAALHLMAAAGRHRAGYKGVKLNLMTLGIGLSAAGKEHPQSVVKSLASKVGMSRDIYGDAGSFKELVMNLIDGHGSSVYVIDEIHSFFGAMRSANAATYESKIEKEVLVMSATNLYTFRGMEKRQVAKLNSEELGRIEKKIVSAEGDDEKLAELKGLAAKYQEKCQFIEHGWPDPYFALMGHSVPARLDGLVSSSDIDGGLIGRSIIARCPEYREKLQEVRLDAVDKAFQEQGCVIALQDVKRRTGALQATKEAVAMFAEIVRYYDSEPMRNDPLLGAIYSRVPEQIYKVASIVALDGNEIAAEHVRYAYALLRSSVADVKYLLLQNMAEAGGSERTIIEHARQVVLKECAGAGQAASTIKQRLQRLKAFQAMNKTGKDHAQDLLNRMVTNEEIYLYAEGRKRRYRCAIAS